MKPEDLNEKTKDNDSQYETPQWVLLIFSWINGVFGSIFRTTIRFIKNIPSRIKNKYLRYRNEKNRMPRRKTRSKVYVLVGYVNKKHVDRKYAALKVQHLIRKTLVMIIIIVFLIMIFQWLNPLGKVKELKQIVGIDEIGDLAQDDPFGASKSSVSIEMFLTSPTPAAEDS